MAAVAQDWKEQARELRRNDESLSERQIAEIIGRAPSSVHEALKDIPEPIPGQQDIDGGEVSPNGKSEAVAEFEQEAGEAVGPMPPREPQVESVYVEQIRVDGTTQMAIDFGGKRAQSATISLSGKAEVDGFFRKGDRIRGSFEAVVVGAGGKDKVDKQTGVVVEAVQSHSAKITDLILED